MFQEDVTRCVVLPAKDYSREVVDHFIGYAKGEINDMSLRAFKDCSLPDEVIIRQLMLLGFEDSVVPPTARILENCGMVVPLLESEDDRRARQVRIAAFADLVCSHLTTIPYDKPKGGVALQRARVNRPVYPHDEVHLLFPAIGDFYDPISKGVDVGYFFGTKEEEENGGGDMSTSALLTRYFMRQHGLAMSFQLIDCGLHVKHTLLCTKRFEASAMPGSGGCNDSPKIPPILHDLKYGNDHIDPPGLLAVVYIPLRTGAVATCQIGSFGNWDFEYFGTWAPHVYARPTNNLRPFVSVPNWGISCGQALTDEQKERHRASPGPVPYSVLYGDIEHIFHNVKTEKKQWLAVTLMSLEYPKMEFGEGQVDSCHTTICRLTLRAAHFTSLLPERSSQAPSSSSSQPASSSASSSGTASSP